MEAKHVATGVEWGLEECAIVKFVIPPLELSDGRLVKLKDANAVFQPIKFLMNNPDGGLIHAEYDLVTSTWKVYD